MNRLQSIRAPNVCFRIYIGMDTSKKEMVQNGNSTNETARHFNCTVKGTLLYYYLINIVVNNHVYNSGQSLINEQMIPSQ